MRNAILSLATFFIFVCIPGISHSQNNLVTGDIAFVSYQSDVDLTNTMFGGTTDFFDRFSIVITRNGGLAAGTILYITDRGWSTSLNGFVASSEGFISWQVPAGGVAQGTEIHFISTFITPTTTWNAYTTEAATTTIGTTTSNLDGNAMEPSSAGDQVLIFQTGPTGGPAGAYNDPVRRFITAIHANVETGVTTYADWDGPTPTGANQSSVPAGLVNGGTAFVMSPGPLPGTTGAALEPDNGKYNCTQSSGVACSALALSAIIYTTTNWTYQNTAFAIGATTDDCSYSVIPPATITAHPSPVTACAELPVSFTANAANFSSLSWQEDDHLGFTSPTVLTDAGVYSGTATTTLTISNNVGLNGRFYRMVAITSCATAVTSNPAQLTVTAPTLPPGTASATQNVNTQNNLYYASGCGVIARVIPSGASPVTGSVTSQVWVEGSVPVFAGQPFVQRHYQITPAVSPATATAIVTLYFSQAEFDAFNSAPGSTLNLPANPTDNIGKANLRVGKYNGSSNDGTGLPGSYTNGASVIDPPDGNIVWNTTFNRWEVTFDVTGFSGFIIQTSLSVLPVKLISFSAQPVGNDIQVKWQSAEETNNDYYELERSVDGVAYTAVTRINGNNGTGRKDYEWMDASATALPTLKIRYRLKMVSLSGKEEYSNTVTVHLDKQGTLITGMQPNPVRDKLNIGLNMPASGKISIMLSDMNGKIIRRELAQAPKGFSTYIIKEMQQLSSGIYFVSAEFEGQTVTFKVVKE
jgi:hypothetical protein